MRAFALLLIATCSLLACEGDGKTAVFDLQPRVAAMQIDTVVKITGRNFHPDMGYTVYFGKKRANTVAVLDDHTLAAKAPTADEVGKVDIIITADNGQTWAIRQGLEYKDMGGGVVEHMGESETKVKRAY